MTGEDCEKTTKATLVKTKDQSAELEYASVEIIIHFKQLPGGDNIPTVVGDAESHVHTTVVYKQMCVLWRFHLL